MFVFCCAVGVVCCEVLFPSKLVIVVLLSFAVLSWAILNERTRGSVECSVEVDGKGDIPCVCDHRECFRSSVRITNTTNTTTPSVSLYPSASNDNIRLMSMSPRTVPLSLSFYHTTRYAFIPVLSFRKLFSSITVCPYLPYRGVDAVEVFMS